MDDLANLGPAAVMARFQPLGVNSWRKHLLGLQYLPRDGVLEILRTAEFFQAATDRERRERNWPFLNGKVVVNLFFEDSTRTRISFSLAARKLGAQVVEFTTKSSSVSKGESFIDTAKTLEALGADIVVVRHSSPGTPHLLAQHLQASILNAGDGAHEHPTQGLLDLFTIWQARKEIDRLTVALVGDIAHSRVARSNIWALRTMGARVIVCGPRTLMPPDLEDLGVEVSYNLDEILPVCDVINILRIQFERQRAGLFPSIREYAARYEMDARRLALAKRDALVLAPGPINRGVEISSAVADGSSSQILNQVSNGLAIRMAVMYLIAGNDELTAADLKSEETPS